MDENTTEFVRRNQYVENEYCIIRYTFEDIAPVDQFMMKRTNTQDFTIKVMTPIWWCL